MESAVKVVWHAGEHENGNDDDALWSAQLLTVNDDGFDTLDLSPGTHMNFELTDERRCVGHFSGVSEREPCPTYRRIDTGSQCAECRRKDVYAGYVEGREGAKVDADFSVYLAQCGTEIKVGVTRTEKVERRWVEQGADYAAEIARGLTSEEALRMEDAVSQRGIKQRVRKEAKVGEPEN
ncbi:MAG: DUF2797 domain-containing protein, partial [Halobacteria archaeon]|nr:DUF2797 domain-containing protein [Halobacteria archaeon]